MMFQKLSDYITVLNRLGRNLAGAGLLVMTGLVTADVIMRRLFNAPLLFADEVSGYLLVLVTLLGVSYTLQEDAHIQVSMVLDHISPRSRIFLKMGICLVGIIYAMILFYLTGQLAWESYHLKAFSPTPSQLPLFPFQMVMPIGCFFLLFQLIVDMIHAVSLISASAPPPSPKKD